MRWSDITHSYHIYRAHRTTASASKHLFRIDWTVFPVVFALLCGKKGTICSPRADTHRQPDAGRASEHVLAERPMPSSPGSHLFCLDGRDAFMTVIHRLLLDSHRACGCGLVHRVLGGVCQPLPCEREGPSVGVQSCTHSTTLQTNALRGCSLKICT